VTRTVRLKIMKKIYTAFLAASLLAGCNSEPVTIQMRYAPTGQPVAGALVQRRSPVSRWEKITNPVGTAYHPLRLAETHRTDSEGRCTLTTTCAGDVYDLTVTSSVPMVVSIGTNNITIALEPPPSFSVWHYWTWLEDGKWKLNVGDGSDIWKENATNKASQVTSQ
jgi:hypothetical protein